MSVVSPTLLKILTVTSVLFFLTSLVRPGKWAIHIIQDVPSYYVVLSCIVYSLYILAFTRALKNSPSAIYILAIAILCRIAMEIIVPHTAAALQMCSQFPSFRIINLLAIYIALFATILPFFVLIRLIRKYSELKPTKKS